MASMIKVPCKDCPIDRTQNPFCRKECEEWKKYELDKSLEEAQRNVRFDAYLKWVKFEGRTGLRKKFAKR